MAGRIASTMGALAAVADQRGRAAYSHQSPPQTAYGMTISSTAESGGGLPDLGIFANEKVYTVFLDMRETNSDRTPSWTLQYSRLRSAARKRHQAPRRKAFPLPSPRSRNYPN